MSTGFLAEVFENSPCKANDLLVMIYLADNASDDGVCMTTLRDIAAFARLPGRVQAGSIIKKLIATGQITRFARIDGENGEKYGIYIINSDYTPKYPNVDVPYELLDEDEREELREDTSLVSKMMSGDYSPVEESYLEQ